MTTTAATTSTTTTPVAATEQKATVDYEAFLQLLTAQLRNQDPLAPMDATQFMTQLAQLSTVEQAMRTNDTLTEVLDTLKSSGMRMDMAFIGREVEVESQSFALTDGEASVAYAIDGSPATVKLEVVDAAGKTVYSTLGVPQSGRQTFTWDGTRSDGETAGDGLYTLRITAKDKAGATLESASVITDTVEEVRNVDGVSQFVLKSGIVTTAESILSAS